MFFKRIFRLGIFLVCFVLCLYWCVDDSSPNIVRELPHNHLFIADSIQHIESQSSRTDSAFLPKIDATSNTDSIESVQNILDNVYYFDIPNTQKAAHASSISNISHISDKDIMLLYFAGSREGARDVGIYQSFFTFNKSINLADLSDKIGTWSEPKRILDAAELSHLSGKFIKKLGNPVSFSDAKGRTHLFVVGVSMGGWATSKIYHLMFDDTLQNLHYINELHLSPFFNFSHLVRTPAMLKSDGGFILPIYHELARKYSLLLHFDAKNTLDSIFLPTNLINVFQPSFIALSPYQSIGVYRNYHTRDKTLMLSLCEDTCTIKSSNIYNDDFSSVLFSVKDSIFLLSNHTHRADGNKREELWIYALEYAGLKADSIYFEPLLALDILLGNEVSYPSAALYDKNSNQYVCIAYTYGRKHIRVAFVPQMLLKNHLVNKHT